jgi:Uncharacterized protein conserved in bacteria (DUF2312)
LAGGIFGRWGFSLTGVAAAGNSARPVTAERLHDGDYDGQRGRDQARHRGGPPTQHCRRIERLEAERSPLASGIKDIFAEAKSVGFEPPPPTLLTERL